MPTSAPTPFWLAPVFLLPPIPSRPRDRSPAFPRCVVPAEVKICGLTRSVDAEFADAAGASYLGVIFAGGPRERSPEDARDTLSGRRARKVGVFADQKPSEIADIASLV